MATLPRRKARRDEIKLEHDATTRQCSLSFSYKIIRLITTNIHWILVPYESVNIVAVVGIGHVAGIVANWDQHIDIAKLPKSSRTSKVKKA